MGMVVERPFTLRMLLLVVSLLLLVLLMLLLVGIGIKDDLGVGGSRVVLRDGQVVLRFRFLFRNTRSCGWIRFWHIDWLLMLLLLMMMVLLLLRLQTLVFSFLASVSASVSVSVATLMAN